MRVNWHCAHYSPVAEYDSIARLYDPWSASVVEDIAFYVEEALASGGPVVELGVGTGRIALPVAAAGIDVIGVDASAEMLAVCLARARASGLEERLDLRVGDLRRPPVKGPVPLVTCPFRAYLHLASDEERLEALGAARSLLEDGGRLVFTLSVRGDSGESTMTLWWLAPERWHALLGEAGFTVDACYDWFDRRPYAGGEDTIWIARKT